MSQTLTIPSRQLVPPSRPSPLRKLVAGSAYVLTGFPLALVAFILLVTGASLALGTLVIVVGFAIAALTLAVARGFAALERTRAAAVLGQPIPAPAYRPLRPGAVGAALSAGADPRRWLDLVHGLAALPVAIVTFSLVLAWWASALGGVSYAAWEWAIPRGEDDTNLAELIGLGDGRIADILLTTGIGLVALLTLPLVVRGAAAVQAGLAQALLAGHAEGPR
jgi:hypothetical protein